MSTEINRGRRGPETKRVFAAMLAFVWLVSLAAGQVPAAKPDPMLMKRRLAGILRQARAHYDVGEYGPALDRLGVLTGAAAEDVGVLNLRGAILLRMGKTDEARKIFESILASDPAYFPATFNLGEVEYMSGNYEKALDRFESMRQSDPRNEIVRFKCFACLLALGRDTAAQKLADGMIPAGASPAWYYAQAALARVAGNPKKAKEYISAAKSIYEADSCKVFDEALSGIKR